MSNNYVVGIYKEVGKIPEFRKVKNTIKDLENLIGGKIEITNFEDSVILFNKNNRYLKPNIWADNGFLKLGTTIKGNIFIINKSINNNYISLTKEQLLNYALLLNKKSFNYSKSNYKTNEQTKYLTLKPIENKNTKNNSQEETLKMILGIQMIILKYIKENT